MSQIAYTQTTYSTRIVANIMAGAIVGLIAIIFNVSYAALIFSGPLTSYFPFGISAALIAGTVSALVVALLSSLPIMCAGPDALTATITALAAGNIAQALLLKNATTTIFPTILIFLVLATTLTGATLWLAGRFRLGRWVRYMPYPVLGGFLAGTGWLTARGAIKVMAGVPVGYDQLNYFVQMDSLHHWLPGILFAFLVLFVTRRYRHFLIMPLLVIGGVALFYIILWLFKIDIREAIELGLLFESYSHTQYQSPWTTQILNEVDWFVFVTQGLSLLALFLITLVDLLLVASGLEVALDTKLDFDKELQYTGIVNLIAGPFGGFVSCLSTNRTTLNYRAGATGRLSGFVVTLICFATLMLGTPIISYIPKPVVGGVLMYLGLVLLTRWLYESWFKLRLVDYALIWIILITIATVGLLPGIGIGVAISSILFSLSYSHTQFVKHELSGTDYPSNRARTSQQQRYLRTHGERIRILWLQGYLFFGTANRLLEQVQNLTDNQTDSIQSLILDFHHVSGVDTSALISFAKIEQVTTERSIQLIYTGLPPVIQKQFIQERIVTDDDDGERFFADLDRGIQCCEDQLLEPTRLLRPRFQPLALQLSELFPETKQITEFMQYMERKRVECDEIIIAQGESSESIYFIEYGEVTIFTRLTNGQTRRIRTIGMGSIFGGLGLYRYDTAQDFIVATVRTQLYILSPDSLQRMQIEKPMLTSIFYQYIARLASNQLMLAHTTIDRLL